MKFKYINCMELLLKLMEKNSDHYANTTMELMEKLQ